VVESDDRLPLDLVPRCLAAARDYGAEMLASDAVLDNELSHAAHQALGFEVVERIVVFRKRL
jgi:hypothetical protein